jgi:hypothetical protein
MSTLRTQGPITTGASCSKGNWPLVLLDRPRRMGPCVPPSLKLRPALVQAPAKPWRRRVAGTTAFVWKQRALRRNQVVINRHVRRFRYQLVAEQARFLAGGFGGEAAEQDEQRLGGAAVATTPSSCSPSRLGCASRRSLAYTAGMWCWGPAGRRRILEGACSRRRTGDHFAGTCSRSC